MGSEQYTVKNVSVHVISGVGGLVTKSYPPPMARSRKCPSCKRTVLAGRENCPHCDAPRPEVQRWADPDRDNPSAIDRRRLALRRMRNGGVMMFLFGIVLMANGVVPEPTTHLKPIGGVGVLFIALGTFGYLWSWKMLRNKGNE